MKKIWTTLVIIAVLLAAWLGAAWYTGTRIQAQTGEVIARFNAKLTDNQQAMGAQIRQLGYERGLLSSHARFAVSSPLTGGQPLSETDVTFSHGPFPLAALQRGNFLPQKYHAHIEVQPVAGAFKVITDTLMHGKPPLTVDIGCSYGQHCAGTGSVPPIGTDLGAIANNAKLTFGGVQMQLDFDHSSDTDYKMSGDAQLLPLSIGGQNFGSGQFTVTGNPQSVTEVFSWKTDQGASKLTFALTPARPVPFWGDPALTPDDLSKLIKTASFKLEVSKSMMVDFAARALNLTKGADLASTRQQMSAQFDAMLASNPDAGKYFQTRGDLLVSDWQYTDGKLTINGQDNPEMLAQIKQGYLARLDAQQQAAAEAAAQTPGAAASAASAPEQAASDQ